MNPRLLSSRALHLGCVLCCAHRVSAGQEGQPLIGQMMVFWTERGMLDAETQTLLARQCGQGLTLFHFSAQPEPFLVIDPANRHRASYKTCLR